MIGVLFIGCVNKKSDVDALQLPTSTLNKELEKAFDGSLIYSDSARIKVKLDYKELVKKEENNVFKTEFPKGIFVTFYDNYQKPNAWLTSKYAIQDDQKGTLIVRDSVVLFNRNKDKLETSELIWNEKNERIQTNKFVRIAQPMRGDTSYGYGLNAKQDFSEFTIEKFSGKGSIDGLGFK